MAEIHKEILFIDIVCAKLELFFKCREGNV